MHKICDPIHGFIRFSKEERDLIDSLPFQRLRHIHQMGVVYLVYPGATHCRFQHSLGVMEVATRIFDSITKKENLAWEDVMPKDPKKLEYYRQILRLAALCHDLGHLPFSHTAEKDLLPDGGHEKMTLAIIESPFLKHIWPQFGKGAEKDVIKFAIGENPLIKNSFSPFEKILSQIITDDNFGADRIDYLLRDAYYTGVGYGHFDYRQLIDTLRIIKKGETLTIGVAEGGIQSVESLWIARYLMYARVYHHPKARLFSNHLKRFMKEYYDKVGFPKDIEGYLRQADYTLLEIIQKASEDKTAVGHEDAAALFNRRPSYKEVDLQKEGFDASLLELEKAFKGKLFIDKMESAQKESGSFRQFFVLKEGQKISESNKESPFLQSIPLGGKELRIYADRQVHEAVSNWLLSSKHP